MPKSVALILIAVSLVVSGCTPGAKTSAPPSSSSPPKGDPEKGFTPIFNGVDLTGWTYGANKNGTPAKAGNGYQVRDGVIYCTVADGGNLFTEKEYDNFALRFEFKLTPGANNGIAIRAPLQGQIAYQGIEIQILDEANEKYAGKIRPEQFHGAVYDCFAPEAGHLKPVGEWNSEEIVANGRHITVTLNGHKIVDANLDELKDEAKLKKHPGLQRLSGHIGFLGHGAQVEFRNLRVKSL